VKLLAGNQLCCSQLVVVSGVICPWQRVHDWQFTAVSLPASILQRCYTRTNRLSTLSYVPFLHCLLQVILWYAGLCVNVVS